MRAALAISPHNPRECQSHMCSKANRCNDNTGSQRHVHHTPQHRTQKARACVDGPHRHSDTDKDTRTTRQREREAHNTHVPRCLMNVAHCTTTAGGSSDCASSDLPNRTEDIAEGGCAFSKGAVKGDKERARGDVQPTTATRTKERREKGRGKWQKRSATVLRGVRRCGFSCCLIMARKSRR